MNLNRIRVVNLVLTALGAVIFTSLLSYIVFAPKDFDERTRNFAISKVQDKVDDKLSSLADSDTANRLSDFAGRISDRLGARVDDMRNSLDSGMDVFIADILAAACKLDCERREEAKNAVRNFYETSILRHGMALERIEDLIEGEYDDVMGELRADLRIFTGSNALALAFAFLLSLFRGRAAAHLLPISLALTGATVLAVIWYAFGQDWVTTVLFSNYWGWAYSSILGVLSVLMVDIAANKARVTSFVFNTIGNGVGSAFNFVPC